MVNPHGVRDRVRLTRDRAELMTDGAIRCRLLLLKVRPLECHLRFPTDAAHLEAGRPDLGLRWLCALFPRPEYPSE
jgi:hypothetical protein